MVERALEMVLLVAAAVGIFPAFLLAALHWVFEEPFAVERLVAAFDAVEPSVEDLLPSVDLQFEQLEEG